MGWNDHVSFIETECLQCGLVSEWEYWDEVGKQRYVGAIGEMVGQDASKPPSCPDCGSTEGQIAEGDE
jgi:Zn finger protein HypA/HybF involved in hydrogenase expression